MQILGVRTSTTMVRYAILEWDGLTAKLLNAAKENRLEFPADKTESAQKLHWLYQELERVLRQNPSVEKIAVKANEYGRGGEKASSREAAYFDAVVLMIAGQKALPVKTFLYKSMKTKRDDVKAFAASIVEVTTTYWNEQMADAVAAAWAMKG